MKIESQKTVPSISDLLHRKVQRKAFMAREADMLPSVSDLLETKKSRQLSKSTEIYKAKSKEVITANTVLGEISYTPATGEAVLNGEIKKVRGRRKSIFQRLVSYPGYFFTATELQEKYDPEGHAAGSDSTNMKFAMHKLRKDLDDSHGELIKSDRDLGYTIAIPQNEIPQQEWLTQQYGEKKIRYHPHTRRMIIDDGEPIKVSLASATLWMSLVYKHGGILTIHELTKERGPEAVRTMVRELRKIVGEDVILNDPGKGYYLHT